MLIIVQPPQPPTSLTRFPGRGFGVLIIVTWNKITLFCLPILAASFYWRAKLILIGIILTLCFHLQQTKHLQALRLSGGFHRVDAPGRGQRLQQTSQNKTDDRTKQSDGCGWKRTKKMLTFSSGTLVDVSLPATLSFSPAASCWGRGQIIRLLKEAKLKFTCKQAVNATPVTIFVNLFLKANNCCVWHIIFRFL